MPRRSSRTRSQSPPSTGPRTADNLEMQGERLKVYSLQTLLTNKKNPDTRPVARLGEVLIPWFEKTIAQPAEKLSDTMDLWQRLIPEKLCARSRLMGLHRGTLTVALDSTTVRAEIDAALRGGILRRLQIESRGAVFRVKTRVAPD